MLQAFTNSTVNGDAMAPILIQTHLDGSFHCTPSVSLSNPHVCGGFVHVDELFPISNPLCQLDGELLYSLGCTYLCCLLIPIADAPVSDPVGLVELGECLIADLQSSLLMQNLHSFLETVTGPLLERRLT